MTQLIQRSFTAGEIAPALRSRADLVRYTTGLRLCENFIVRAQGGVYSRPGTRFVGEVNDSTRKPRLISFSFNVDQTYILVFEHLTMRVIRDGGFILATGGSSLFEMITPYTESQLFELSFAQSADVVTIVHHDHDPANLSRIADNNWLLEVINYGSTVTPPTAPVLSAVGSGYGDFSKTYTYVVATVDVNGVESLPSPEVSISQLSLTSTGGIQLNWDAVGDAEYYRVYKDPSNGTGVYGWIGDSNTSSFVDYNTAPITSDAPQDDRQPFSTVGDKPSTVGFYQQRQVFANTYNEPQAVYTTQTGNYISLRTSTPARDDDAVTFTVAGNQINEIRHILSLNALVLLTSGGEWLTTEGQNEVLSPSTVGVRAQSFNGSSRVKPVVINDTVIYIQEKGTRIRDLAYQFSSDKYTGNDLSLMSEHLFEGHTIVEMAYAAEPYGILWCVRSDGVLLGLTYQREHQVAGWHKHTTSGTFESVATISEDGRDAVYVVVKRNINGSDVRYVERLEKRYTDSSADCFFVDSGLSYNGSPITELSGLQHLENEEVAVLADGNVVKNLTVLDGSITLPRAASIVHVGLAYTCAIETLDIDLASQSGTVRGKSKTISKVYLDVEKSRGGFVGPVNDAGITGTIIEIKPRFDSDNYDSISLKTFKEEIYIEPTWSKGAAIRIEQRGPLPMAILSVIPDVDFGG